MTADLLKRLIQAGLEPDLIAEVADLEAKVRQDDLRREKNRDRMRAVRAHRVTHMHVQHTEHKEVLSLLREENKKEVKKESTRGTRLAPGWTPTDPDWQFALTAIGEQAANSNLSKFRDYWTAKAGSQATKVDWGATWRNWCRRVSETSPAPPAPEPEGEWINGKSRWLHEQEEAFRRKQANGNHHQEAILGGGSEIRGSELPSLFGEERPKEPSHH